MSHFLGDAGILKRANREAATTAHNNQTGLGDLSFFDDQCMDGSAIGTAHDGIGCHTSAFGKIHGGIEYREAMGLAGSQNPSGVQVKMKIPRVDIFNNEQQAKP